MHKHDLAGSSLLAQVLLHGTRRRYRIFAVAGIALVLLSASWMYFALGTDRSRARQNYWFSTKESTSGHQTQKNTSQGGSGSVWSAITPLADAGSLIPPKIWQIMLPKKQSADKLVIDPEKLRDTTSWLAMNTDYA